MSGLRTGELRISGAIHRHAAFYYFAYGSCRACAQIEAALGAVVYGKVHSRRKASHSLSYLQLCSLTVTEGGTPSPTHTGGRVARRSRDGWGERPREGKHVIQRGRSPRRIPLVDVGKRTSYFGILISRYALVRTLVETKEISVGAVPRFVARRTRVVNRNPRVLPASEQRKEARMPCAVPLCRPRSVKKIKNLRFPKKNACNLAVIVVYLSSNRKFSSAGRALALQARGHRFEPYNFHHTVRIAFYAGIAQW